jgi:ATP-binding cassette subfamily B multidrug efflux pump
MQPFVEEEAGGAYDWRLVKWVWSYVRPYRRLFLLSIVLMPLNSAFALAQPYVFKLTIDIFLAKARTAAPRWLAPIVRHTDGHGLLVMGLLYLVLLAGEVASFYGQFYLTMVVAQYSLSDLRLALFRNVERLPMAFFDRTPVGRLVSRMTTDIDAINEMFSAGSLTLFIDFLTLAGIVVIMFSFNARLAAWSLCAVPPLLGVINFFRVRMRIVFGGIRDRLAALNAYLSEALSGMAVIQLFAHERESRREFERLNQQNREIQRTSNIYDACLYSSVEALSSITIAVVLWIGGGEVLHRVLSLGTLVAFIFYAQLFFNPLREVSSKYTTLQSALAAIERIEALMATPVAIASPLRPKRTRRGAGSIVFEEVSFEYRPGEPVLRDLSFRVAAGQRVAIVGPTGAGKSTVIKLLNRLYDVTAGRILVDGVDVREWELRKLRRTIGLVLQDVFLFAEDIFDNVRLSRLDLDEADVLNSLRRAQALSFVERLPDGVHQAVYERGANLSTGQRQLLSFARALAYNPRILVMDEATSSVDSETERLIQLALNELLAGRTSLVIAHRLSTIERADRILVLSNGVLRESGTHEELLRRQGLYRRLFELQYATAESVREAVD